MLIKNINYKSIFFTVYWKKVRRSCRLEFSLEEERNLEIQEEDISPAFFQRQKNCSSNVSRYCFKSSHQIINHIASLKTLFDFNPCTELKYLLIY